VSEPVFWSLAWAYARAVALREALEAGYCDYALTLAGELELELAAALARCGRPT
jgi:hypothetical protein